ncbi:MAG: type II secretion system protein M [Pseudomonadales bacterium]|nr:type II secretion system protein M [Pseudomonadales bacterium]
MTMFDKQWQEAKQRFTMLPSNDQRALLLMVAVLVLAIIYLVFSLSYSYQRSALTRFQTAQQDARWMELNRAQLSELAVNVGKAHAAGGDSSESSLLNRATKSAKPFGISFKRFQPQDENGLRLWIEGVEFDQLMRWFAALDQQHIRLEQIEVSRQQQAGAAEARVLLSSSP